MNSLTLRIKNKTGSTSVDNRFIDDYMAEANGEFVKVYLYLLRCVSYNKQVSISVIADKFNHTETDVLRALKYWEKLKLLHLVLNEADVLTEIHFTDIPKEEDAGEEVLSAKAAAFLPVEAAASKAFAPEPVRHQEMQMPAYSPDRIRQFQEDSEITQIIFVAESYLGKTLSPSELNTLLFFYDERDGLGFSVDLIEYLIEYCVSKGHKSINQYARKTAIAWAEQEIRTVTQAKAETIHYHADYYKVFNALGIKGRKMVPFEAAYIEKWLNTYCFTLDIVTYACERTLSLIHQPDFKYTDTILTSWHKSGVKHLGDARLLDQKYQEKRAAAKTAKPAAANRYSNLDQRSYDYNELEKQLLTSR